MIGFDVHGVVRIGLQGDRASGAAVIRHQLGVDPTEVGDDVDIVVYWTDRIEPRGALRYVGLHDAAFDDDSFYVLQRRRNGDCKARVDLSGEMPCRISCERGMSEVPLLIALVNLIALGRELVPVHAAAFTYEGSGALVAGWAKGGKTETLLAFMARGAVYVGDEWVYVRDGAELLGLPEPIKLWDWHLDDLPPLRAAVGRSGRTRLAATRVAERSLRVLPGSFVDRAAHAMGRQRFVHAAPEVLFGSAACATRGLFDKLVCAIAADADAVVVEPVDASEVAHRMVPSLVHERLDIVAAYQKHRFAFPERRWDALENIEAAYEKRLRRAFAGKDAYLLRHPFPAPIPALFDALAPVFRR